MTASASSSVPPIALEALRQAIAIYMELSYPDGGVPESVNRRLSWPREKAACDLLQGSPFEKLTATDEAAASVYGLRLGNARYPHMKLQIQSWPNAEGYLLSVNTHDQVLALNPNARDLDAFRVLQAENKRMKEAVEEAWDRAGLPTFLRYLRNYLEEHGAGPSAASE